MSIRTSSSLGIGVVEAAIARTANAAATEPTIPATHAIAPFSIEKLLNQAVATGAQSGADTELAGPGGTARQYQM